MRGQLRVLDIRAHELFELPTANCILFIVLPTVQTLNHIATAVELCHTSISLPFILRRCAGFRAPGTLELFDCGDERETIRDACMGLIERQICLIRDSIKPNIERLAFHFIWRKASNDPHPAMRLNLQRNTLRDGCAAVGHKPTKEQLGAERSTKSNARPIPLVFKVGI